MFSDSDSTAPDPGPVMGALGESENAHRRPDFLRCAPRTSAVGSAGKDGSSAKRGGAFKMARSAGAESGLCWRGLTLLTTPQHV